MGIFYGYKLITDAIRNFLTSFLMYRLIKGDLSLLLKKTFSSQVRRKTFYLILNLTDLYFF